MIMSEIFDEQLDKLTEHLEPAPAKKSLYDLLCKRYPANEYALMKEVSDSAGFNRSRSADYVAVNLWPSRGLAINGIEVKSFRSDWLSELKNPEKAEKIFQYCDYFWLLTTDDNVAKLEEIPASWGWLSVKSEKILVKKEAPKLQPVPLTRNFLCAMLKRATDKTDFIHIDNIKDRIEEAKTSAIKGRDYKLERATKERDEAWKIINDFRTGSGIDLKDGWEKDFPKKIGEAVKFIQSGQLESIKSELLGLEKTATHVLHRISEGLKITL